MIKELIVAAGCFWCVESDFEKLPGVTEVTSGYAGGVINNPTYKKHGLHTEAVKIEYDPSKITFTQLVEHFYDNVDYEDGFGQFCDRGESYRPAIWVPEDEDEQVVWDLQPKGSVVPIYVDDPNFHPSAESEGHQDYYKKNPIRYNYYRYRCGRDARLQQLHIEESTWK